MQSMQCIALISPYRGPAPAIRSRPARQPQRMKITQGRHGFNYAVCGNTRPLLAYWSRQRPKPRETPHVPVESSCCRGRSRMSNGIGLPVQIMFSGTPSLSSKLAHSGRDRRARTGYPATRNQNRQRSVTPINPGSVFTTAICVASRQLIGLFGLRRSHPLPQHHDRLWFRSRLERPYRVLPRHLS